MIRNQNFIGGRPHHHGGKLTALHSLVNHLFRVRARLLIIIPFASIGTSATLAPRIEVYTTLACSIHRPDIFGESFQQLDILDLLQDSNDYGIPAVAHQSRSDIFMIGKSLQTNDAAAPPTRKQRCASDPVVQAAVAKLTSGVYKTVFFLL